MGEESDKPLSLPKGHRFVSADYSQIELRVMAHMSKDEGLLTAFQDGEDVHSKTASEVFNVDIDAVTTDLRRNAKAINFRFDLWYFCLWFGQAT